MKETDILHSPATPVIASRLERLRRWGETASSGAGDPASGAAWVFSARQRLALLAGFGVLLVLRIPLAWWHGRLLTEEGTIFAAFAWHRPASEALWRSFAGYLNLGANASTLAMVELVRAGLLPLERAPYFTMTIAWLFQLVPAVLILNGRGCWLANRWAVIACLLFIAISPMTEEVFANVLHIQFHLALATALILVLDVPVTRMGRVACWLPLVLAPLCGPGAIVLLPLFVLRSLVDRDKARLEQTLVLAASAAVQMVLFYTRSPVRGHLLDPVTLLNVLFVRFAALPYLSAALIKPLGKSLYRVYLARGVAWWCLTVVSVAYFVWLARVVLRSGRGPALWLVLAGLTLGVVSFGAGMLITDASTYFSVGATERYNFLPLTLLSMGLVALARSGDQAFRGICFKLCLLTLASGALTFFIPIRDVRSGPLWQGEVAAWRQDHDHRLATWPEQWQVDLSDRDRPCHPLRAINAPTTDPSYCESNWRVFITSH